MRIIQKGSDNDIDALVRTHLTIKIRIIIAKYIDAEKLIAEIEWRRTFFEYDGKTPNERAWRCLGELLSFIDSLQQEQISLPSNLDEAAEEYAYNNWEDNDYHTGASEGLPFDAIGHTEKCFKAGAEWMAGQMKQKQIEVDLEKEYIEFVVSDPVYSKLVNDIVGKSIARHFYELGLKEKEGDK